MATMTSNIIRVNSDEMTQLVSNVFQPIDNLYLRITLNGRALTYGGQGFVIRYTDTDGNEQTTERAFSPTDREQLWLGYTKGLAGPFDISEIDSSFPIYIGMYRYRWDRLIFAWQDLNKRLGWRLHNANLTNTTLYKPRDWVRPYPSWFNSDLFDCLTYYESMYPNTLDYLPDNYNQAHYLPHYLFDYLKPVSQGYRPVTATQFEAQVHPDYTTHKFRSGSFLYQGSDESIEHYVNPDDESGFTINIGSQAYVPIDYIFEEMMYDDLEFVEEEHIIDNLVISNLSYYPEDIPAWDDSETVLVADVSLTLPLKILRATLIMDREPGDPGAIKSIIHEYGQRFNTYFEYRDSARRCEQLINICTGYSAVGLYTALYHNANMQVSVYSGLSNYFIYIPDEYTVTPQMRTVLYTLAVEDQIFGTHGVYTFRSTYVNAPSFWY